MKELLCIVCPNGCRLQVEGTSDKLTVTGNKCNRGIDFARAEITNPMRSLTTTVRTNFADVPVFPVRTAGEIPKGKIRDVMRYLNDVTVTKPLAIGDAVAESVLGLGVNVIATSNLLVEMMNRETA
jgi:CxxC motif-containing protein